MLITKSRFWRVKCQPSLSFPKAGTMCTQHVFWEKCYACHHDEYLRPALYLRAGASADRIGRTPRPELGRQPRYSRKHRAASEVRCRLAAVFTPTKRLKPEARARPACSFMTRATLVLDRRRRFGSTSLCMIQTKAPAARLLKRRVAHSGSARALKTRVKSKSRRPMAPLARAVEITQKLRQLGDIRRDPPRLVAREQTVTAS